MRQTPFSGTSIIGTEDDRTAGKSRGVSCGSPVGEASGPEPAQLWPRLLVGLWVGIFWVLVFLEPVGAALWFAAPLAVATAWLLKGKNNHDNA